MKNIQNQDALEVWSLAAFKAEWIAAGFATTIPVGGTVMPRKQYALTMAAVVAKCMNENEASVVEAVYSLLLTVLGNASQLGARLQKEKWFSEATPSVAADALLAQLQARIAGGKLTA